MKVVHMRCTGCGSRPTFVNQALDVCREKCCERCGIKLTVVSSNGYVDAPPMPDRERTHLTGKEILAAKRILVTAFAEKGVDDA